MDGPLHDADAAPLPDEPFHVGVYRTRDTIANFRARVRVRKVTAATSLSSSLSGLSSLGKAAKGDKDETDSENSSVTDLQQSGGSGGFVDEISFGWQEKHFNESEFRFYSGKREADFDGDVLKKKLYHEVQKLGKKGEGRERHKIYTTLDGELIQYGDDTEDNGVDGLQIPLYTPLTTNPNEEPSALAQLVSDGLRRRRHLISGRPNGASVADKTTIPQSNIVEEHPTRETQLKLHTLSEHFQTMVVRFDLMGEEAGQQQADHAQREVQFIDLCVLKYGSNGVMEVSPDFSQNGRPYRVEMNLNGENVAYEYWIEHASPGMQYNDQIDEHRVLTNFYAAQVQPILRDVGDVFEDIPQRAFRLVINGEIVSAEDFDYDGLSIHYFVELPPGWSATQESQLTGLTHTSKTTCDPRTELDVAYFSHIFEIDLYFDIDRFDIYKESLPQWPQIFFEVISVDSWTRCRTEGYGFTSVPYMAGSYDLKIDTWRPLLPTPTGEMKRYFVGGTPELDDLTYAGTPCDVDGKILSRYGFRTISSGRIGLRINTIHQAKAFLGEKGRAGRISLFDRLSSASLFSSVTSVLEAFRKARQRFVQVTEGYERNEKISEKVTKEKINLKNGAKQNVAFMGDSEE